MGEGIEINALPAAFSLKNASQLRWGDILPLRHKRGIVGSFHKVSAKYMPLYVAEFQFRYNHRSNADIFGAAISGA